MAESDRIKWDQKFAQAGEIDLTPPNWLQELDAEVDAALPKQGYALDMRQGPGAWRYGWQAGALMWRLFDEHGRFAQARER